MRSRSKSPSNCSHKASSGIGRELSLEFGARVEVLVLVARRLDRLEQLRQQLLGLGRHPGLKVVVLSADLSEEHEAERLLAKVFEQAGAVDVLVNNAGLGDSVLFDHAEWARTRQILRTNIFAVAQITSALVPGMVERRRGGVLNIGSGAGLTVLPNAAAYVGSKHFIAGFSEALRADLSGTGVTVSQVCPGPVESEFDQVSGSPGGMVGAPPPFFPDLCRTVRSRSGGRIRARTGRVFPGRAYRFVMKVLPLLPLWLRRKQASHAAARLRATRNG